MGNPQEGQGKKRFTERVSGFFPYLQHILEAEGYPVELISGVTSFCAVAARLGVPLAEWNEPLHILPAVHKTEERLCGSGNLRLLQLRTLHRRLPDERAEKEPEVLFRLFHPFPQKA